MPRFRVHKVPNLWRTLRNFVPHTGFELLDGDVVVRPTASTCSDVLQHGLHPIQRFGKNCIWSLGVFELVPQGAKTGGLIGRQKTEQAISGLFFGQNLCFLGWWFGWVCLFLFGCGGVFVVGAKRPALCALLFV